MLTVRASIIFLVLVFLSSLHPAVAQNTLELSHAKRSDIARLMDLTNISQKFTRPPKNFRPRLFRSVKRKYPRMPVSARRIWVDEVERYVLSRMPELVDQIVRSYHREFGHDEIKGLIGFYSSDLGRKSVKSMERIAKRGRQMGFKWGQRINRAARAEAMKKLQAKGFDPAKFK